MLLRLALTIALLGERSSGDPFINDALYEGHWEYFTSQPGELHNNSLCPWTTTTEELTIYKYICDWTYVPAQYIPPIGYSLLPIAEAVHRIRQHQGFEEIPLNITILGDSLSEQLYYGASCITEHLHLLHSKINVEYHKARFFRDNPCGCDVSPIETDYYVVRKLARCDPPWESFITSHTNIVVVSFGLWFGTVWMDCDVNVVTEYHKTFLVVLPELKALVARGVIVVWMGIPYRNVATYSLAGNDELFRSLARKYLVGTGVIVVDPISLVKDRVVRDSHIKHDVTHYCGYAPASMPVFMFQLILTQIAHLLHYRS